MLRTRMWVWMIPIVAAGACADITGPVEVDPGDPAADFSKHAKKSCYRVHFTVTAVPTSPFVAVGTLSGDLEGTVLTEFDPESVVIKGNTIRNKGTVQWTITGGAIPGLESFVTSFRNMNVAIDPPGTFKVSGRHRAVSGVKKARLRYRGLFSPDPTPQVVNNFKGRICV